MARKTRYSPELRERAGLLEFETLCLCRLTTSLGGITEFLGCIEVDWAQTLSQQITTCTDLSGQIPDDILLSGNY